MSSVPDDQHPPKPRLTLRVGVTGKRKLPLTEHRRIRDDLTKVFEILSEVLADCWESNRAVLDQQPPILRVVTGLAEGADQLAAAVAIDRVKRVVSPDSKTMTRFAAILPFWRAEFIKDFEHDPNRDEELRTAEDTRKVVEGFDELLSHAREEGVLEIHDEALLAEGKSEHRDLAYVALRDLLIAHSDVLIAIVDDNQKRKPGGSTDVIQLAVQEGLPVIRIGATSRSVELLYPPDLDSPDQRPHANEQEKFDVNGAPPDVLIAMLNRALAPPPPIKSAANSGSADHYHEHHATRSGRARLADYLGEDFALPRHGWLFKACRNALLAWSQCNWRNCWARAWSAFRTAAREYEIAAPSLALKTLWRSKQVLAFPYSEEEHFRSILARRYIWADKLAVRYADATRSSYIAIAALGALAVFVGMLSTLFWGSLEAPFKILVLGLEGAILGWAGTRLYRPAHNGSWHERMVEARVLAELLRHQRFVYAMGGAERTERMGDRSWRERDAWLGWYVRATVRELGFPSADLSSDYRRAALAAFHVEEVQSQIAYNWTEFNRSRTIDETLGVFVERAWRIAVQIALFGAALVLALYLVEIAHMPPYSEYADEILRHLVKPVLTILLAVLPAVIAAVHGVRFQMEFANAAKRAETTHRELLTLDEERIKPTLASPAPPGRRKALSLIRAANEAMIADLTGWSTVYKNKAAEPPG